MYDALVIGSGMGGLGTALFLAKAGMKVLVLEKNRQFGGALQIFSRDKQILDTGVHYVGSLGKDEALGRYFRYFGIYDKLDFVQMDTDAYDRVCFRDEAPVHFAQGFEHHADVLSQRFPHKHREIHAYVKMLAEMPEQFPFFSFRPGETDPLSNPYSGKNAFAYIYEMTGGDMSLTRALFGAGILYDFRPQSTSLYTHGIIMGSYIRSAWRFKKGGAQIARQMIRRGREMGVEYRNYAEVSEILTDSGGVTAVKLKDGEIIPARRIISNIHPHSTLDLLKENRFMRNSYIERVRNLPESLGCFSAQFVMQPEALPYENFNTYYTRSKGLPVYEKEGFPNTMGIFPSLDEDAQTHTRVLNVMTYMHPQETAAWKESFRTEPHFTESRGTGYEALKSRKEEAIVQALEELYPGFGAGVQNVYSSTSLTFRDYLGSPDGSLYGILQDSASPASSLFSPRTKVPGLFLSGQNLNLHGILGVSISSAVTAASILGAEWMASEMRSV